MISSSEDELSPGDELLRKLLHITQAPVVSSGEDSEFDPPSSDSDLCSMLESDIDSEEGATDFKSRLADCALNTHIPHSHLGALLKIMTDEPWGKKLPTTTLIGRIILSNDPFFLNFSIFHRIYYRYSKV